MILPDSDFLSGAPTKVWAKRREIGVVVSRIATSAIASDRGGYTPIRYEELRAALGCDAPKPIMDWLASNDILECDREASPGRKAYWWRWGPRIRSLQRRHQSVNDPASLRAWDAIRGIDPGVPEEPDAIRDFLRGWVNILVLDPDLVEQGLNGMYDDADDPFYTKRLYAMDTADILMHGDAEDKQGGFDMTAGRFHSVVTRSPRWMRSAMRINDRPMWSIDCRSLQPLVQGLLAARDHLSGGRKSISGDGYGDGREDRPTTTATATRYPTPTTPPIDNAKCTYTGDLSDLPDDLAEFFAVYTAGDFYLWLAVDVLGMPCGTPPERDAVKQAWAHLVFCNPMKSRFVPGWSETWDRYKSKQPTITAWIERTKASGYADAAIECQRVEASVMVRKVVLDLMDNHPDLPIITVHDCIMTIEDGIQIVERAIIRAWTAEGVVPRLKVEPA